ncbi:linoleate diol synthase [Stachybotrys elegans]|uniref:linoleate 8R-lipoxygenase n=1 Tax=Stachybotrys elegans TaxID=80388 RepID=A0A8K0SB11_9HYPO|nr:linoleate diol synthase [Stachybotrys elegans]
MASSPFAQLYQVISRALSPVPKYPYKLGNDDSVKKTGLLQDVQSMKLEDYKTINDMMNVAMNGEEDDDTLLLERTIAFLARLPSQSQEGQALTDGFVNTLWGSLVHPPNGSLGDVARYRTADGSNNNLSRPLLGAANTSYCRTIPSRVFQGPNFPDPELVFDSIMNRGDGTSSKEHPNKLSSQLFYLAIIITHDVFQTDHRDANKNLTSSYLDLSPLYGRNQEEQAAMRAFKFGLLKPDCFSNKGILRLPPGVGVFLIMFNRFHNYVAGNLALINENNRFPRPDPSHATWEDWVKYDEHLFQTARLITCGLYVNIILKDYVRTILNLNRSGSTWDLDPRSQEKKNALNSNPAPEATGNQVSVEFNLIYRWHSTLSKKDEYFTNKTFRDLLNGIDPAKATTEQMEEALMRFEREVPSNPQDRDFAGLVRGDDNTYSDDELVAILTSSIEDVAGAFGANQVPSCCRALEVLGIIQARNWHVATLNEFRQHFQLKKHETFEDINPDPLVAARLKSLYDSPDAVELYPGLVSEKTKPPMDGSGLCVNYTTSRAILSDAVALVRGDRFYTIDYTPRNLTNWGYNEADFDLTVNQGHVMHKLIFRAFPNHFAYNSIYAHFPFVVPDENKVIHDNLKTAVKYDWAKPTRKIDPVVLKSHKTVCKVLSDNTNFHVPWGEAISYLVSPSPDKVYAKGFCLSGDGPANKESREHVRKCLYAPTKWEDELRHFYKLNAQNLLEKASYRLPGSEYNEVDIIRDVIIPLNTRFVAAFFGLPIKTEETSPHGIYSDYELYMLLTVMFMTVFFDSDPANSFKMHTTAKELALQLEKLVQIEAEVDARAGWVADVAARLGFGGSDKPSDTKDKDGRAWPGLPSYGRHLISRMMEKGKSIEECVAGTVMPISAAGTTIMSGLLSQCLDYFLGDGSEHLPELYRLAKEDTVEADGKLMHYMLEGIRLRGTVVVARYVPPSAAAQEVTDTAPCIADPSDPMGPKPIPNPKVGESKRTYVIQPMQRAIIDLTTASHDESAFPEPETLRLDRPLDNYLPWGFGPHKCLGEGATRAAMMTAFKVLVGTRGLSRAPGPRGHCKSVEFKEWRGQVGRKAVEGGGEEWTGLRVFLSPDQSGYWPVPTTMKVTWLAEEARGKSEEAWVKVGRGTS